ncbi:MAG: hypothetical protein JW966_05130 [Anaerolineae bacterium]|nr:hypothetical protein [Anaerolineae bacterium]
MHKLWHVVVVTLIIALFGSGCGLVDDTRDTVDTVDEAVDLLQDVDKNGVWTTLADGLEALGDQEAGFLAAILLEEGAAGAGGAFEGVPDRQVTVLLQVDGDGDMLADVSDGEQQAAQYYVEAGTAPDVERRVYRVETGGFHCLTTDDPQHVLLSGGLTGLFEAGRVTATGIQLLVVADKNDDDSPVLDRDATHYDLVSRVPDALDVLAKTDNDELKAAVRAVDQFDLSGEITLDDETGALLRYDSSYAEVESGHLTVFRFEITRWSIDDTITPPADADIVTACEPD